MLVSLGRGAGLLGRGAARPIARWIAALGASLREIGVRDALAADSAGRQLLDLLERLGRDLANDELSIDFPRWRRWLARQLEAETYRDSTIDSPVVFTSLAATRLRPFDAALVLGADAVHLPGPDPVAMFFNQGVRAELSLPTWAERVREMEEQLAALIACSGATVVTWQRMLDGEGNLLSPQFERLDALHRLAYHTGLDDLAAAARLAGAEVRAAGAGGKVEQTRPPAPAAPALLPRQISASGYNSLIACPYQYFARYVLRLAELDDVQEVADKRDYGILVHRVLTSFHTAFPAGVSALDPARARLELEKLSDEAFAGVVERNYLAQAWLARWKALIPDYLDWQRAHEHEGWTWQAGEVDRAVEIATPAGASITLRGRLDRVDSRQASGEFAVIDYKTRASKSLRDALELPGEDVQLPVYALLWGRPVAAALYLSIERDGVSAVELEGGVREAAEEVRARLAAMHDALAAGAKLRAQGIEQVCEYCDVRGLCRKNHWHE
jgi:ATP-dependent helicase/nuclease subunit B